MLVHKTKQNKTNKPPAFAIQEYSNLLNMKLEYGAPYNKQPVMEISHAISDVIRVLVTSLEYK